MEHYLYDKKEFIENEKLQKQIYKIEEQGKLPIFEYLAISAQITTFASKNLCDLKPGLYTKIDCRIIGRVLAIYFVRDEFIPEFLNSVESLSFTNIFSQFLNMHEEDFLEFKKEPICYEEILLETYVSETKNISSEEDMGDFWYRCIYKISKEYSITFIGKILERICHLIEADNLRNILIKNGINIKDIKNIINKPIKKLNIENIKDVALYGIELKELAELIIEENGRYIDSSIDIDKLGDMKKILSDVSTKDKFLNKIFKTKSENLKINKQALDNLRKYLDEQEKTIKSQIDKFGNLKQLIEAYIMKVGEYTQNLRDKQQELGEIPTDNKSNEIIDIQNMIDEKTNKFFMAGKAMYQEYLQLCVVERIYHTYLGKIVDAEVTYLPLLYVELIATNGLLRIKEVGDSIEYMGNLLNGMEQLNVSYILEHKDELMEQNKLLLVDNLKEKMDDLEKNQDKQFIKK